MIRGRYFFLCGVLLFLASAALVLRSSGPDHHAPPPALQLLRTVIGLDPTPTHPGYNASQFTHALRAHAQGGLIYLASVDSSYLPMALNLYQTSFKKLGIENYLFACSDSEAYRSLQRRDINAFDFLHDKDSTKPSAYGTKEFRRKTHMKTKIILDALEIGLNVIIIDVDIVLFKVPLPFMDCADCDIQIQSDVTEGNSGFYMARATKPSMLLHQKAWEIAGTKGESISNQKALDRNMEKMSRQKELKMKTLPTGLFPPGKVYFEDKRRMFFSDNPPKDEVLVHNNWIVSKEAKIYRFKEQLQWMVDTDGYYSDPNRKYLVYANDAKLTYMAERDSLKTALLIGNLLNRTVILPTFSCLGCVYGACKVASKRCSFNTHFKIASFDRYYEGRYREHVFLQHPLVPKTIADPKSQTQPYLITNTQHAQSLQVAQYPAGSTPPTILQHKDPKGPVEAEILAWFGDNQKPVLRFASLNGIYGNFKDKSFVKDAAFNTHTDYRQYDK